MTFVHPWLLLLLLPFLAYFTVLGWPGSRHGRTRAWAALAVRCLVTLFLVLGLAGAQWVSGGDELSIVFLVDVSDSISATERERALLFVEQALAEMGPSDRAALVLFGADALVERPMVGGGELGEIASVPHTHQTNLEGAIRLGIALFPAGTARRMVILSDGRPTLGDAEEAVRLASAQGIQVVAVPLDASLGDEAWLSDLVALDRLHEGEEFTLTVTAHATTAMEAILTVLAGDAIVAQQQVHLNPGANTFAVPLVAGEPGFAPFRAYLTPVADVYSQNNALSSFSLVEGPPRVLVVVPADEGEGDEGESLVRALQASGLEVTVISPRTLPADPAGLVEFASVVLVDTPARALPPQAMGMLQSYVRDLGGGLVAVGGPHAFGVGGWFDTPLEETLPVEMTLSDPQRFPPMAIVVVIDKSGSMAAVEGGVQKIRLAGEAAARVAELITELDEITVIAFDDRPVDVIGPLPGSRRDEVIEQVTRLQAGGGGIYVRESLQEALRYLADSERSVRHIILLADGSDAEHQSGVPQLVEDEIAAEGITLSTVAIGAGQDLRFLEGIAALGNGRYYFTARAADLPVIFAAETQLAMRSYIVEEPFYPRQTSPSPILSGIEAVPQLAGYVATTAKPAGRVILSTHQGDPLLAAWQYGLGRSVAWTSDASARWAQRWVGWEGFARFWAQAVRWTVVERASVPVELTVTMVGEEARITVDATDEGGAFLNGLQAQVSLVGPGGEVVPVELTQTAPGRYEGVFVPQEEGAHLMRLAASLSGEEVIALTTGWVMSYSPEYAALEADPAYMAGLAELGGGAVVNQPAEVLVHDLKGSGVRRDMWPYLLGLAALLLIPDVGLRRLALDRRDLVRAWRRAAARLARRGRPAAVETPSPVARLFEAKSRAAERRPEADALSGRTPPLPAAPSQGTSPPRPEVPSGVKPAVGRREEEVAEEGTLAERLRRRRGR